MGKRSFVAQLNSVLFLKSNIHKWNTIIYKHVKHKYFSSVVKAVCGREWALVWAASRQFRVSHSTRFLEERKEKRQWYYNWNDIRNQPYVTKRCSSKHDQARTYIQQGNINTRKPTIKIRDTPNKNFFFSACLWTTTKCTSRNSEELGLRL